MFRREEVSHIIKKCNDFGAGGVSVAIGELAPGLQIDLDKVPKKYAGLDGTEIAISESQERMAVVVDLAVANDHELDIKSTMMYRHEDYVDAIDLVNAGKVHLRPLISKTFKFKDYLKAYQYIDENRETTMKVIINVQEK